MNIADVVLVIAGVGWIMGRRIVGQLLEARALLIIPVILTIIGVANLKHLSHVPAAGIGFIALSIGASVVIGLIRGTTVHLGERQGQIWMRYTVPTVLLWLLNLGLKVVLYPVEHGVSAVDASAAGKATMLAIGLGMLAEGGVVMMRALPRAGQLVWSKGKDGAPHTTHPQLERLQQQLRTTSLTKDAPRAVTFADLRRLTRNGRDW